MYLLQFSDSALPVGTFSFSNGLETAAQMGVVHDASTLEAYVRAVNRQSATTDGVAALAAWRASQKADYEALIETDCHLLACKLNEEARQMLCRMGRKLAELSLHLYDDALLKRWLTAICAGEVPGTYPVAQGLTFSLAGLSEEELFVSHQYGVAGMILNAALRCVRVSHYDTQQILYRLADDVTPLFEEVRTLSLEGMHTFAPQSDVLASLHEKGDMRMFMN